jgi:hypothetical protein
LGGVLIRHVGEAIREHLTTWGELFDYLTGGGIDDFSSFSRLGGSAYSPLSVGELGRSYQRPAL